MPEHILATIVAVLALAVLAFALAEICRDWQPIKPTMPAPPEPVTEQLPRLNAALVERITRIRTSRTRASLLRAGRHRAPRRQDGRVNGALLVASTIR